ELLLRRLAYRSTARSRSLMCHLLRPCSPSGRRRRVGPSGSWAVCRSCGREVEMRWPLKGVSLPRVGRGGPGLAQRDEDVDEEQQDGDRDEEGPQGRDAVQRAPSLVRGV